MTTADEYRGDETIRAGMREYFASLSHVSDVGRRRDIQFTCYAHAVFMRDFELLASVLETDVPVDAPCLGHGATAIIVAAGCGSAHMVRLLLGRGARVNVESWEGFTPLEQAVFSGNAEIVSLLLKHGADPNYRTYRGTPLEIATSAGYGEIAELLRDVGASDLYLLEETALAGFPSFSALFEKHPRYQLALAQVLESFAYVDVTLAVLDAMLAAIARSADAQAEVAALLAHYNWRFQLVGAFAALLGLNDGRSTAALWDAFDSGSAVSPQLAVAAQRCDQEFMANARVRIEAGCPILANRFAALNWYRRGAAARPLTLDDAPSRATAALIDLCREHTRTEPRRAAAAADGPADRRSENSIALSWRQRINAILSEAGPVRRFDLI